MLSHFFVIYIFTLSTISVLGIIRYSYLDTGLRIFLYLMIFTLMSEITAFAMEKSRLPKTPVFHTYAVIHIAVLSYYFVRSNSLKTYSWTLPIFAAFSILIGVSNLLFFQPIKTLNSNTILFDCFLSITLSLSSLLLIAKNDVIKDIFTFPHFYIWTSTLILWTSTFFFWALLSHLHPYKDTLNLLQTILNILIYGIIAFVFFKTKRWKKYQIDVN